MPFICPLLKPLKPLSPSSSVLDYPTKNIITIIQKMLSYLKSLRPAQESLAFSIFKTMDKAPNTTTERRKMPMVWHATIVITVVSVVSVAARLATKYAGSSGLWIDDMCILVAALAVSAQVATLGFFAYDAEVLYRQDVSNGQYLSISFMKVISNPIDLSFVRTPIALG